MLFVTFRLQESIPKRILEKFRQEHEEALLKIGKLPPTDTTLPWTPHRKCQPPTYSSKREAYTAAYKRYFAKLDNYLDTTLVGPHFLKAANVGEIIQSKLKSFDEQYYWLVAYTVMSNHVHVLLDTYCQLAKLPPDTHISTQNYVPYEKFMQLIKGNASFSINQLLGRKGRLWQHESYDHLVRNAEEFRNIIWYILNNPVKAGLVNNWLDYPMTYLRPEYASLYP
jgi:putative transposase